MNYAKVICVLCFSFGTLCANDGYYSGAGGVLRPTKNTVISIQREWLHLKLLEHGVLARVHVRFHLLNPTTKPITIDVGMVVPRTSSSSNMDVYRNSVGISEYTANANGKVLRYTLMEQRCDTCPLKTPSTVVLDSIDEPIEPYGDWVFVSKVTFKPGVNVITHSYVQFASGGMATQPEVSYRLTTGRGWARGQIDTFECTITPPPYSLIHIAGLPRRDGAPAFIGVGKSLSLIVASRSDSLDPQYYYQDQTEERYRVVGGSIRFERHNFVPKQDLFITTYGECSDIEESLSPLSPNDSLNSVSFREEQRSLILGWYGVLPKTTEHQAMLRSKDWFIHDPQASRASVSPGSGDENFIIELEKPRTK